MLRRSPASSIAITITIATAILIAGCGGGDDDSSPSTSTTTTIVITTTTADPNADPDDPFCGTFMLFGEVINLPQNTLEQARARAAQISAAGSALQSTAPDELVEQLDLLVGAAAQLELAATAATTLEEAQAAEADFEAQPEVVDASTAMLAWIEDNCEGG